MTEQELPWLITGPDNGQWMYGEAPHCSVCSLVTAPSRVSKDFRLRRGGAALSSTYDGANVVSSKFVSAVHGEPGVSFLPLPADPDHFVMSVGPVVRFDSERRGTRFGDPCNECGRPSHVIGATPVYLREPWLTPRGFSRTDLEFGDSKDFGPTQPTCLRPMILVDHTLARRLAELRLTGLWMEPITA